MAGGVVVTGASTGIGAATARLLASRGFVVVGTVRRPADGAALAAAGVHPVVMDVTEAASIRSAHERVMGLLAGAPLAGLVNNAGIAVAGALELLPLEDVRRAFEVNVVGVVAATQAFLPELRRSRGRIVNISSVSGTIAAPFAGPYAASKFALEAISDSWRRELIPAGVNVIVIQPGSIRTPIWDKVAALDLERYRGTPYEHVMRVVHEQALRSGARGLPPEVVANAVLRALMVRRPKTRMLVVRSPLRARLMRLIPDRWIDRAAARVLWRR